MLTDSAIAAPSGISRYTLGLDGAADGYANERANDRRPLRAHLLALIGTVLDKDPAQNSLNTYATRTAYKSSALIAKPGALKGCDFFCNE